MIDGAAANEAAIGADAGTDSPAVLDVQRAVAMWRRAVAATYEVEPETEAQETELSRLIDTRDHLARSVMLTPALGVRDLLAKVEVLDFVLNEQHEAGENIDCRDVVMIGAIKADLLSLRHRWQSNAQ